MLKRIKKERFISISEAAKSLDVSESTIRVYIFKDYLETSRKDHCTKVNKRDVATIKNSLLKPVGCITVKEASAILKCCVPAVQSLVKYKHIEKITRSFRSLHKAFIVEEDVIAFKKSKIKKEKETIKRKEKRDKYIKERLKFIEKSRLKRIEKYEDFYENKKTQL